MQITNGAQLSAFEDRNSFFRYCMPYAFVKIAADSEKYVPVNRDYAPLGVLGQTRPDLRPYFATHAVWFQTDPKGFKGVWWSVNNGTFWLYDHTPESRLKYFQRLERLMFKLPSMGLAVQAAESAANTRTDFSTDHIVNHVDQRAHSKPAT